MREEELMVAIAGMVAGVVIFRFLTTMATRVICHWRDVSLKIRMIESGMSGDEIEQVVLAGRYEAPRRSGKLQEAKQRPKPAYANQ